MQRTDSAEETFVEQLQQLNGRRLDSHPRAAGHQQCYVDYGSVMVAGIFAVIIRRRKKLMGKG